MRFSPVAAEVVNLKIHRLTLGPVATNCYIVGDEARAECVIIDPADPADQILAQISASGWALREIWITHAHFDHILALGAIQAQTGVQARMHPADIPTLDALPQTMRAYFNREEPAPPHPALNLSGGDLLTLGAETFEVRFVPGHAPGHVAFIDHAQKAVFSGDCVFYDSIGRTDLPGSDYETLMRSIQAQLLTLPDDYTVYPGHGQMTTIGRERIENPFLVEWLGR
jgi:glyoxylase-like metal-dependent hydrolase (beta-lactamase superfamily II)